VHEAAAEIEATAVVPAPPEEVFEFLSDLSNHWRLVDRFVEVLSVDGDSGRVRLQGPFGVRRTVRTHVTSAEAPHLIVGVAELGSGTRGRVSWRLDAAGAGTRVRLAASVESASRFDRLLLALGGRVWMRRRFAFGLARLGELLRPAPASAEAQALPD
jgi:uncharacterized protein YndB with AHSA1/START domain